MKNALANMTLARWIIVVSLLASIGLGYYGYNLHTRRLELESALKTEVRAVALDLRTLARQYSVLSKQVDREGFSENVKDPATYIRQIAAGKDVQIGDITVDPPSEAENIKGVLDTRYSIKPADAARTDGYGRLNIANFLFKLESESRRMRVTHLRLDPKAKGTKPELTLENDSWIWDVEVTSRTKIEAPPPASK